MKKYLNWCIILLMLGFFVIPYNCSGGGGCSCDPKTVEQIILLYSPNIKNITAGPKCGNVVEYNSISYIMIDFIFPIESTTFTIQNNTKVTFYNSQTRATEEIPDFFTGIVFSNYVTYEGKSYPFRATLNINKAKVNVDTKYTSQFISKSPNSVKTRTGAIIDTTFSYSFTVRMPDGVNPYITGFLPGVDLNRVSPRLLSDVMLPVNFSEPLSSLGFSVEDVTAGGTLIKDTLTDFSEGKSTVNIRFGSSVAYSLGHTIQVKFLSEKTQCDLTTRDMSGEPLTVPPGQMGYGSAINDVRTFKVGKIWLYPGVGGNRVTVSPAFIRGLAAPDVTRVRLESTTGEKPVEVDVQPPSNPNSTGYFSANFFFKTSGRKTIYARNVDDPNDYDVISFDYYPESITIDTIKYPCMFPGGKMEGSIAAGDLSFSPIEDVFDVNRVLAYLINNNDASCINSDQGGCGLCNYLYYTKFCSALVDTINNSSDYPPTEITRIDQILPLLGFIKKNYQGYWDEKEKRWFGFRCDCIPEFRDRLGRFYDPTDFCLLGFTRCCPDIYGNPAYPGEATKNICEDLKGLRDIAMDLTNIGGGPLSGIIDTVIDEREKHPTKVFTYRLEILDLMIDLRNSSMSFSEDNSSSFGHFVLRLDVEGGHLTGVITLFTYLFTLFGKYIYIASPPYATMLFLNNFNLQFDIIPELIYNPDTGREMVRFRIENNSKLSQPVIPVSGSPIEFVAFNWFLADYINSNDWARKEKSIEGNVNKLLKPLILRKINNRLGANLYNSLEDVPIKKIYFRTGTGAGRCFDGSYARATLTVELPPKFTDNP